MNSLVKFVDPLAKLMGDWAIEINVLSNIFRIVIAIIMGAIIGCERSSKRHSAGLRTFILVTLMGAVSAIIDSALVDETYKLYLFSTAAIIGTVIISGNSILFSSKKQIKGLTTSAGLWLCEILGLVIGLGFYLVALILAVVLILILAVLPALEVFLKDKSNHFEIHLELKDKSKLQDFIFTIRHLNLRIDDMEINNSYFGSGLSVYSISLTDVKKKYRKHKDIIAALSTLDYVSFVEEL